MSAVPSFAETFRKARPLFDAARKAGLDGPDAVRVVELVLTWRFLRSYLGRPPVAREHYAALDISHATYYRRLELMRKAYGVQHLADVEIAPAAQMPTLSTALGLELA